MGGPPLVAPNRVKVGGSDKNEEEELMKTWLAVIAPRPLGRKNYDHCIIVEGCIYEGRDYWAAELVM